MYDKVNDIVKTLTNEEEYLMNLFVTGAQWNS